MIRFKSNNLFIEELMDVMKMKDIYFANSTTFKHKLVNWKNDELRWQEYLRDLENETYAAKGTMF